MKLLIPYFGKRLLFISNPFKLKTQYSRHPMQLKVTTTNKVSDETVLSEVTERHVTTRETHITLKTPVMNLDRNSEQKIPSLRFPIFYYTPFSF